MKGSDRNSLCPCGSGKKRKRCEPAHAVEGPTLETGAWTRPPTQEELRQRRARVQTLLTVVGLLQYKS